MNYDPTYISSIIALVAVVVGPVVSLCIAKKQIKASVVSSSRLQWINRLRDELAVLVKDIRHVPPAYAANTITKAEAVSMHGQITSRAELIKLLINPKEEEHQKLVPLLSSASNKVIDSINKDKGNAAELEVLADKIVAQSQIILKREWERVKSGY
ncbi:MAG: hypothetical protein WCS87_12760 [Methylococcaceae bacterium]